MDGSNELESLWENLLSRESGRVVAAYCSLSSDERLSVLTHLRRMVAEAGWQEEQRNSARVAINILEGVNC